MTIINSVIINYQIVQKYTNYLILSQIMTVIIKIIKTMIDKTIKILVKMAQKKYLIKPITVYKLATILKM